MDGIAKTMKVSRPRYRLGMNLNLRNATTFILLFITLFFATILLQIQQLPDSVGVTRSNLAIDETFRSTTRQKTYDILETHPLPELKKPPYDRARTSVKANIVRETIQSPVIDKPSPPDAYLDESVKNKRTLDQLRYICGELCDTNRPLSPSPFGYFDAITSETSCSRLFSTHLIDASSHKVPKRIPHVMLGEFSMNKRIPIEKWWIKDVYLENDEKQDIVWTRELIDEWIQKAHDGDWNDWGNYYPIDRSTLFASLQFANLTGKRVLVIGSEKPWVEALCLAAGAATVTTLEYARIVSRHPLVRTVTPSKFRVAYLGRTERFSYDVVVSYSSLEHAGLGRYGDALNPWGDIMSLARAWCVTKTGGKLVLGLSTGSDRVYFNAGRIYGPLRWPYLTTNWIRLNYSSGWWKRDDILNWTAPSLRHRGPEGCEIWRNQSSFVFQKTGPKGSKDETFL